MTLIFLLWRNPSFSRCAPDHRERREKNSPVLFVFPANPPSTLYTSIDFPLQPWGGIPPACCLACSSKALSTSPTCFLLYCVEYDRCVERGLLVYRCSSHDNRASERYEYTSNTTRHKTTPTFILACLHVRLQVLPHAAVHAGHLAQVEVVVVVP